MAAKHKFKNKISSRKKEVQQAIPPSGKQTKNSAEKKDQNTRNGELYMNK